MWDDKQITGASINDVEDDFEVIPADLSIEVKRVVL